MKFLADENIAPRVIDALRKEHITIRTIKEERLSSADDETIIAFAKRNGFIIITHDKDFGNLLHYPLQSHAGVILLRLKNQSPDNTIFHILSFLKKVETQKIKNRLIILKEKQARII